MRIEIENNKDISSLIKKCFFTLFPPNVINKILQFVSTVFIVRLVTKEAFG